MSYPKISIITPSYNQAPYLEKTILSVLNQNYPNLEYIIIDGGSKDNSVDIIKKYEKTLTYWVSEKDLGQYHAIQKGFEKSTGEIMAWINSDDIYHTKSLFTVAEIFNTFPEIKWLTGNLSFIDEQDRIVHSYLARRWSRLNIFTGDSIWIQQESTFWKRSLWEQAGSSLNLNLNYAADFELWIRFFRHEKLYTTEALLGAFRARRKNQKTVEEMPSYMKEYNEIIRHEKMSEDDKSRLRQIKVFENYIQKIPFFRSLKFLKKKHAKAYDYPPIITFDRELYRYISKNIFE